MKCRQCKIRMDVVDSRNVFDGTAVRRRRHCKSCGERVTTYETVGGVKKLDPRKLKIMTKRLQRLLNDLKIVLESY